MVNSKIVLFMFFLVYEITATQYPIQLNFDLCTTDGDDSIHQNFDLGSTDGGQITYPFVLSARSLLIMHLFLTTFKFKNLPFHWLR